MSGTGDWKYSVPDAGENTLAFVRVRLMRAVSTAMVDTQGNTIGWVECVQVDKYGKDVVYGNRVAAAPESIVTVEQARKIVRGEQQ